MNRSTNTLKSAMGGLKRDVPIISNRMIITLLIFCLVTSGCALIKLKNENTESLSSTVLVGRISTVVPGKGPIIVDEAI